jgi:hypothetical protein
MKQFKIQITTKGTHSVECATLNVEKFDVDQLSCEDVYNMDTYYLAQCAIGDEWEGNFLLKVYDDSDTVGYESSDISNFARICAGEYSECLEEHQVVLSEDVSHQHNRLLSEQDLIDRKALEDGMYVLVVRDAKWRFMEYFIEAESFDPSKLLFVYNPQLEGVGYDYYSDENHVFYDGAFLENKLEDIGYDDYGCNCYVMERVTTKKESSFRLVREIQV